MRRTRSLILAAAAALAGAGCDKLGTPLEPHAVARWVEFTRESISVAGPGCVESAGVTVKPGGAQYPLRLKVDTAIVDTESRPHGTPGWWWLQARKSGVGRVIAYLEVPREQSVTLTADTLYLKVGDIPPSVSTPADTVWLQPPSASAPTTSTGVRIAPTISTACGTSVDANLIDYTSTNPEVASVDPSGAITALRSGAADVRLRVLSQERTTHVQVRRVVMQPADTTVFVGDTIRFRMMYEDDLGRLVQDRTAIFSGFPLTYASVTTDGLVTATRSTAPNGAVTVQGTVGSRAGRGWRVDGKVTIRERTPLTMPAPH